MDVFSTFDIDSVVVYYVFIFWHLVPPYALQSVLFLFHCVSRWSLAICAGTFFLRVEGLSFGLYPFLFFLFVVYWVLSPSCSVYVGSPHIDRMPNA